MKLIVGLGNPGKKYDGTRHNAGFMVVEALLRHSRNHWVKGKGPFEVNGRPFQDGEAVLAKPAVFMNESGRALKTLLSEFRAAPNECLVVLDDVNLPIGKIRFRSRGSAGGHHGLESVIEVLGTEDIPRLRIGVASGDLSGQDLTEYVLSPCSKADWDLLNLHIERARDACLEWVRSDALTVMQRYNH